MNIIDRVAHHAAQGELTTEILDDLLDEESYITACERCSPNSLEFEGAQEKIREELETQLGIWLLGDMANVH